MQWISRILVGLVGLLSLQGAWHHWFQTALLADERGMQPLRAIGRANIRADVGGIFLAIGIFALMAAWKRSSAWTLGAIVIVASTLTGRFVSAALDGLTSREAMPMGIEAGVIAILLFGWAMFKKGPEGL